MIYVFIQVGKEDTYLLYKFLHTLYYMLVEFDCSNGPLCDGSHLSFGDGGLALIEPRKLQSIEQ